ncbi:MAG: J domain-containing protein [Pseudomonadota bacterium]
MGQRMSKSYSYADCYRILGLTCGCNWSDVRLAYKKLIQKWHPDRYTDDSAEKSAANDRIKTINIAHQQLSTYYRKNNKLPEVGITEKKTYNTKPQQPNSPPGARTPRSPGINKSTPNPRKNRSKKSNTLKGLIYITFLAGAYTLTSEDFFTSLLELISGERTYPNDAYTSKPLQSIYNKSNERTTQNNIDDSPHENTIKPDESPSIEKQPEIYFSNGSSMGDVVLIQGVPTTTKDNIWYYGKSEIHFHEGKVTHWVRTTRTPLKAQLKVK